MLNEKQQLAVLKVLQADDFILIKGFPGTGKTETLVALIEFLIRMNKSVIVTAHTNTAIDNILLKLLKHNIDFIRFGSVSKMHPDVVHKSDEILTANCDTPESLHTAYCSKVTIFKIFGQISLFISFFQNKSGLTFNEIDTVDDSP